MYDSRPPKSLSKLTGKKSKSPANPWDFDPSNSDQRAAPSAAAGDYYGTGFKAKIGRLRGSTVGYRPVTREQMGTPPKSVV
jgi:hypothetical protein